MLSILGTPRANADRVHTSTVLVATLNAASSAITATILAYFVVAALTLIPYVFWRRRATIPASASD